MDPIAHVVLGHCLNVCREPEAVRGRGLAITLGALAPDIDLLFMPAGWDRYLVAHEIGTHAIAGALTSGVLAAGVATLVRRRTTYRALVLPAVIASVSHVFADLLSGASIRLGWPLLDGRVSNVGVVAMADPLMIAFAVAGGAAMLIWPRRRQWLAVVWLTVLALLALEVTFMRERAEVEYRADPRRGATLGDYVVEPTGSTLTRWRVFDRTATTVRAWSIDVSGAVNLDFVVPIESGDPALIHASLEWDTVENFRRAHDLTFARATQQGVEWSDVRYCWGINGSGSPQCGIWAGGEFSRPPHLARLIVRVGDLVQGR